jgi:biotin carboxylase
MADPGVADDTLVKPAILAEEFIEGREYSADFVLDEGQVRLIRVAKKLRGTALPFGTTSAYIVPAKLPGGMSCEVLGERLCEASAALGLRRAICMVDFIISKGEVIFLELTPRIGGDCLPPLIRKSCGLDTIGLALDFAEGREISIPAPDHWHEHVGLRLISQRGGTLSGVGCEQLREDPRVKEISIQRVPGHKITLPPEDYDSWLLGYVIFEPHPGVCLRKQCNEIRDKIVIKVESRYEHEAKPTDNASCPAVRTASPAA